MTDSDSDAETQPLTAREFVIVGQSRYGEMVIHVNPVTRRCSIKNERIRGDFALPSKPNPRSALPRLPCVLDAMVDSFLTEDEQTAFEMATLRYQAETEHDGPVSIPFLGHITAEFTNGTCAFVVRFSRSCRDVVSAAPLEERSVFSPGFCYAPPPTVRTSRIFKGTFVSVDPTDGRSEINSFDALEFWLHFRLPRWLVAPMRQSVVEKDVYSIN